MRLVVIVFGLAGCNQVFGLHGPRELDAHVAFFDAPADAPFACPPIGTTPRFSPLVHQAIVEACFGYTTSTSANLATAYCNDLTSGGVMQGPVDQPLTQIPGLANVGGNYYTSPRLVPEGDQLFAQFVVPMASASAISVFQRTDTQWSAVGNVQIAGWPMFSRSVGFGVATRGPDRRFMVFDLVHDQRIHELAFDGTSWTDVASYDPVNDLDVTSIGSIPNLSPDGLRMVLAAVPPMDNRDHVMYSDRPTVTDRFRPAVRLTGAPDVIDPFLTEDCARIYFSGFGSVFYVEQQ